jgi:hypothetical protein
MSSAQAPLVTAAASCEHGALEGIVQPSPGSMDDRANGSGNPPTEHCVQIVPAGGEANTSDVAERWENRCPTLSAAPSVQDGTRYPSTAKQQLGGEPLRGMNFVGRWGSDAFQLFNSSYRCHHLVGSCDRCNSRT